MHIVFSCCFVISDLNIRSSIFCSIPGNVILSSLFAPDCKKNFFCSARNFCIFQGNLISLLGSICIFHVQFPGLKRNFTGCASRKIHISCNILQIYMCIISSCVILMILNIYFCHITSIVLSGRCVPDNITLVCCAPYRYFYLLHCALICNSCYCHIKGSLVHILGCNLCLPN